MRRAAHYLHCDFFTLLDRVNAGEWHWLNWATAGRTAEEEAYGPGFPPVSSQYAVPWRPPKD